MVRLSGWLLCGTLLFSAIPTAVSSPQARQTQPEATSLLGRPLYSPEVPADPRARLKENLVRARGEFDRDPNDPEAIIWLGRRTAYLGRYQEAIAIYSQGLQRHPRNAKLYRHRGHRYLTVRQLDKAVADLDKAARLTAGRPDEVEPDGAPNPKNIPRSTTQTNIWYHLGLAYYLKGDFTKAARAFSTCLGFSRNHDMSVATRNWLYLTLRRRGREDEARRILMPISRDMDIIENFAYHALLLLYKGEKSPEALLGSRDDDPVTRATLLYGLGTWYLINGQREKAQAIYKETVEGQQWAPFGYLAAEAELARDATRQR